MQIVKSPRYLEELEIVIGFIAEDSLSRALDFADRLRAPLIIGDTHNIYSFCLG